jgi:membrane-associated phospholipid phosphatase
MRSWKYTFILAYSLMLINMIHGDDDKISWKKEIVEWSVIAGVYAAGHVIGEMDVWTEDSFLAGVTDRPYHESTIPSSWLKWGANLAGVGLAVIPNNSGWMNTVSYTNIKGFAGALSLNRLLTNVTKNAVGRKRPSFDNYQDDKNTDSRKSFFSGHASTAFCIATYSSLFVFNHLDGVDSSDANLGKWLYATGAFSLAAFTAYSRVADNKHHISDVITGSFVGSSVAWIVYRYYNGENSQNVGIQHRKTPISVAFSPVAYGSGFILSISKSF